MSSEAELSTEDLIARTDRSKAKARDLRQQGDLDTALSLYHSILDVRSDADALWASGQILADSGYAEDSIPVLAQAAQDFSLSGRTLRAIAVCREILVLKENNQTARSLLADLYTTHSSLSQSEDGAPSGLASIPLFSRMSRENFVRLAEAMTVHIFAPGDTVCRFGEPAESLFLVAEGSVRMTKNPNDPKKRIVVHLQEGAFFGEIALWSGRRRNADFVVESPALIYEVSRTTLKHVLKSSAEVEKLLIACYRDRMVANLLAISPLFQTLGEKAHEDILAASETVRFSQGEFILVKDQEPTALYIILDGQAEILNPVRPYKALAALGDGDFFGEASLLENRPVYFPVRTTRPSIVLRFLTEDFNVLHERYPPLVSYLRDLAEQRRRINIEHHRPKLVSEGPLVGEFMSTAVHTVSPDCKIDRVISLMGKENVSCVVVCAGPRPIGIVSQGDILKLIAQTGENGHKSFLASDIMSSPLLIARPHNTLEDCLKQTRNRGVRRLPVSDEQGRLVGIVTESTLLHILQSSAQTTDLGFA